MAVRVVRKLGDPVLRRKAEAVNKFNGELAVLLDDMKETMEHYKGLGLAAPQMGTSQAVVVIRLGQEFPLMELVNPQVEERSGSETGVEGCLSIPGTFGEVERSVDVTVSYCDRGGIKHTIQASQLLARVLQHEIDHLNGVLFVDKVIRYVNQEEEG